MAIPINKITPYNVRRMSRTPVPRRAINLVKGAVITQPWDIVQINGARAPEGAEPLEERIAIAKRCFNHPNNVDSFQSWVEQGIEDLCVAGAFVAELRVTPDPSRPVKSWCTNIESIRMFPAWSESVAKDYPHYAQMTGLKGERGAILFYDDQMMYIKDNPATDNPFGLGRLEVAFLSINYFLGIQDMSGKAGSDQIHKCFPGSTEVLTRKGWIRWSEVRDDEEFATRSQQGELQWQRALGFVREQHEGDMIQFSNRALHITVTPNHRMYGKCFRKEYETGNKVAGPSGFIEARELFDGVKNRPGKGWRKGRKLSQKKVPELFDFKIPTTTKWTSGRLPGSICKVGERTFEWKDWAAFLGIWIAEGSCLGSGCNKPTNGEYRIQIAQSRLANPRKYIKIKKLLDRMGFQFQAKYDRFIFSDRDVWDHVSKLGSSHTKFVPQWIKDSPADIIQTFFEWAMLGDGSVRGKKRIYYTASRRLAGDMQELFQKIGSSAAVQSTTKRRRKLYAVGEMLRSELSIIPEGGRGKDRIPKRIPYAGMVYCAMVPNGTLYCRENGHAFWSGNTWLWWEQPQTEGSYQIIRRHIQNELEGQAKVSIIGGMKKPDVIEIQPVKEEDLLLHWQEMLIRMIANAFDLSAMSLGIEHDVNRAVGSVLSDRDFRSAIVPLAKRLQEGFTRKILHEKLGWYDIEFKFLSLDDPDIETKIDMYQRGYAMNAVTPAEFRRAMGWPKSNSPFADLTQFEAMIVNLQAASDIQLDQQKKASQAQMEMQNQQMSYQGFPSAQDSAYSDQQQIPPAIVAPGGPAQGQTGGTPKNAQQPKPPKALKLPQFPINGSSYTVQDIAGMSVSQLHAAFQSGQLPSATDTVTQMDRQDPTILEQLTVEVQQYLKSMMEEEEDGRNVKKPSAKWLKQWKKDQLDKANKEGQREQDFGRWLTKYGNTGRPGGANLPLYDKLTQKNAGRPGRVNPIRKG